MSVRTRALLIAFLSLLAIPLGALGAEVTFARDVWPVLERHCTGCHQPGEIAPMPFTSYREVRPWARSIREAVRSRAMPPWSAEAGPHRFRNDRSLSAREIQTISDWVDRGASEGDGPVTFTPRREEHGWNLGAPDQVIKVPGFKVPESGQLPYTFLIVSGLFPKDTWIRAAEWRIDHREAIHHINAFTRPPDSSFLAGFPVGEIFVPTLTQRGKRQEGEGVFDRRQLLQGYEPGYEAAPWLDNGAKFVKAGSDVVFEMHYTPNGKAVTDYSELALYFAAAPPAFRVLAIDTLRDLDLAIPPGQRDYVSHASMTLAHPARLLSIQPHMHLRGKSMSVRAVYPDGHVDALLDVPKYDFHWQTTYAFEDPLKLPAGTKIESTAGYDNSPENRYNPDPAALVHWGDQTTEEMHIAFMELVIPAAENPESLFQSAPRSIDSLSRK